MTERDEGPGSLADAHAAMGEEGQQVTGVLDDINVPLARRWLAKRGAAANMLGSGMYYVQLFSPEAGMEVLCVDGEFRHGWVAGKEPRPFTNYAEAQIDGVRALRRAGVK